MTRKPTLPLPAIIWSLLIYTLPKSNNYPSWFWTSCPLAFHQVGH